MPSFTAIPKTPQVDITPWLFGVLTAITENVEVLMGARVAGVRAVTSDSVQVAPAYFQTLKRITANGAGYSSNGAGALPATINVASLEDHVRLAQDVQTVITDLARIEAALNTLLTQLRS